MNRIGFVSGFLVAAFICAGVFAAALSSCGSDILAEKAVAASGAQGGIAIIGELMQNNRTFTVYFNTATNSSGVQLNDAYIMAFDDKLVWLVGKTPGSNSYSHFVVSYSAITHITGITPALT